MNSTALTVRSMEELAHRSNDGIDVTLFWHRNTDELMVCVRDRRLGAYFEIEPEANNALDTFYHPYSYASLSRVHDEDDRLAA